MLRRSRTLCSEATRAFDFVVVGGGAAGSWMAPNLAYDAASVLVLEQGPDPTTVSKARWNMPGLSFVPKLREKFSTTEESSPQEHINGSPTVLCRSARALGGDGICGRRTWVHGDPVARWGKNIEGWHVSDFRRAFRMIQSDARDKNNFGMIGVETNSFPSPIYRNFAEVMPALDVPIIRDFNKQTGQPGVGRAPLRQDTMTKTTSSSYRDNLVKWRKFRPSLHVECGAHVDRVLGLAAGSSGPLQVSYTDSQGRETVCTAKQLIMAAGAIETPRILLRSGVDVKGIGQNLIDYPVTVMPFAIADPVSLCPLRTTLVQAFSLFEWHARRGVGWLSSSYDDMMALIQSDEAKANNEPCDIRITLQPMLTDRLGNVVVPPSDTGLAHGFQFLVELMTPSSRGTVTMDAVNPNFLATEADKRRMQFGVDLVHRIVSNAKFLAGLGLKPLNAGKEGYEIRSGNQASGTCALGTVVGANMNLRDTPLFIADSSILPAPVGGDTHPTTLVAAEMISQQLVPAATSTAKAKLEFTEHFNFEEQQKTV